MLVCVRAYPVHAMIITGCAIDVAHSVLSRAMIITRPAHNISKYYAAHFHGQLLHSLARATIISKYPPMRGEHICLILGSSRADTTRQSARFLYNKIKPVRRRGGGRRRDSRRGFRPPSF
jgi:hypothetical protein